MAEHVLRSKQAGLGDGEVLFQCHQLRAIPPLQVLRNGKLSSRHIRSESLGAGPRQMSKFRTFADGVLECQSIQPDQFVARLHLGTTLDDPIDRAVTSDFAFDFRVVGTLQSSLFGYRDEQVVARDRMSQHRTGFPRMADARQAYGSPRQCGDQARAPGDRVSTTGRARNPVDRRAAAAAAVAERGAVLEGRQLP